MEKEDSDFKNARVAPTVERPVEARCVAGSNPAPGTIKLLVSKKAWKDALKAFEQIKDRE